MLSGPRAQLSAELGYRGISDGTCLGAVCGLDSNWAVHAAAIPTSRGKAAAPSWHATARARLNWLRRFYPPVVALGARPIP